MWSILICSTLLVFTAAVPPIVPNVYRNQECVDGVNNVIDVGNVDNSAALSIQINDAVVQTYDIDGKPSCYYGRASVQLPGRLKFVKGTLTVSKALDLKTSGEIRLTLKKDSFFVGTVCQDGISQKGMVPSEDCHRKIYPEFGDKLVEMMSSPGTYDLEKIEKEARGSNVIKLPPTHGTMSLIVQGDWKAEVALVSNNVKVADIKAPSNTEWLYIK
ncbi:hypothetical protein DICVIV_07489 [Dictyocaulus viviparus]|uniref:Uncharacterized protein n=1 Tax=Dictyocaulus viviparus TaxID=29172 RepID=A0A0D8XRS7_DICVI|nr:hypothetical protein DICVIV_07489 [Dictyocaulus viviparus]